jgi:nucleotide-binding universal stress UspA family protein
MKILIAYDGSEGSKSAIEDMRIAGIPETGVDARILCVAEYAFPADTVYNTDSQMPISVYTSDRVSEMRNDALETAELTAEEGSRRVRELFPGWKIDSVTRLSSPASTILSVAKEWEPDLLVIGSHGRSALGRIFMGSVSLRVVNEAACSVRVVKQKPRSELTSKNAAPVIVLAFDGSEGSRRAVNSIVDRQWPAATALCIVAVADTGMLDSIYGASPISPDFCDEPNNGETRLEQLIHSIESEMKKHFQTVNTSLAVGSPSREIVSEAKRRNADMIFIGSHRNDRSYSYAKFEHIIGTIIPMLGSVAHGVSANASTTVEVVR